VDEKGRVLVKNAEGYFFSADGERNDSITANRKKIGTWEIFTIHRYGGDTIALESYHGKFVHVQDKNPSYLRAVGDQAGKQEKFLLENP
jgi:hypothetical protein